MEQRAALATTLVPPELNQTADRLALSRLEALIEPFKFDKIRDTLRELGIVNLIATDVHTAGEFSHATVYRGVEFRVDFAPKIRLEIVIPSIRLEEVIEAVSRAARTRRRWDEDQIISYQVADAQPEVEL